MKIEKVIICGLGALGLTYANKLKDICELKILADFERIKKYKTNPPIFNNKKIELDYILPTEKFDADLIVISTKFLGLDNALDYIKNFITPKTIIISLINGISSEEIIASRYNQAKVIRSYFIGHSAMRVENNVNQDGIGKLVIEKNDKLESFFSSANIQYEVSENIIYSQWVKLGVNIVLNQLTALDMITVGELRKKECYFSNAQNLLKEVKQVAQKEQIENLDNFIEDVFKEINLIADDGKTSMYQDILANKKTEVDIFSGEILRLAKIHQIETPYNKKIYDKIKEIEKEF